ncbi:MAG TPA: M48 family metalloprotease [Candidatus Paceibacterota bacterium]
MKAVKPQGTTWKIIGITIFASVLIAVLAGVVFRALGYYSLAPYAGIIAVTVLNVISFFYSDKIILRMHGAEEVDPHRNPELYDMVGQLSQTAGIPIPKLYIIEDDALNAFATGRDYNHSAVAVYRGLLDRLDREELRGVLAHEIAHIKNYDMLTGTLLSVGVGFLAVLADMIGRVVVREIGKDNAIVYFLGSIILFFLIPIGSLLIQMFVSRKREFAADRDGAHLAKSSDGLARALIKLEQAHIPQETNVAAAQNLYIIHPFRGGLASLFSSHPSTEDRVARLQKMVL